MSSPPTNLRGVGVAAVAAVAVSGAVALAGTDDPAGATTGDGGAPAAPGPALAAADSALTPPAPLTLPVPGASAAPGPVLDTAGLAATVTRAQAQARSLADEARTRADAERAADGRASDDVRAEEERTAQRARRAGRAADPEPAGPVSGDCGLNESRLGPVKTYVRTAAELLGCTFGKPTVLGVAGRAGASDHPRGRALDFLVDRATGDRLAACAVRNREALGVSYVIWRQRIDTGSGFRPMEDRGSPTANHFDHVHVSFEPAAGTGEPVSC